MAKDLEISFLLDFYGDMLTEKQRAVIEFYYNEDLSLSLIHISACRFPAHLALFFGQPCYDRCAFRKHGCGSGVYSGRTARHPGLFSQKKVTLDALMAAERK